MRFSEGKCVYICVCVYVSCSVWTDSLQPHGLYLISLYIYIYIYIYIVTNAYVEVSDNNDIMDVTEELGVFYHYKVPALLVNQ